MHTNATCAKDTKTVLYATLKAFHLLAVIVWVGGMAFVLFCLRPAARVLEPPVRIALMHAALRRFLAEREPMIYGRYAHWWDDLPSAEVRVLGR